MTNLGDIRLSKKGKAWLDFNQIDAKKLAEMLKLVGVKAHADRLGSVIKGSKSFTLKEMRGMMTLSGHGLELFAHVRETAQAKK